MVEVPNGSNDRIVITPDDLDQLPVQPPAPRPLIVQPEALRNEAQPVASGQSGFASTSNQTFSTPRSSGAPFGTVGHSRDLLTTLSANTIVSGLVAGIIGAFVGFLIAEVAYNPDHMIPTSTLDAQVQSGVWVAIFACFLGLALNAWPGISSRSAAKALSSGAVGAGIGALSGFIGGFIAQWLYWLMIHNISQQDAKAQLLASRSAGWAVFGALLGVGLGIRGGAKKALTGLLGGALGGALGGFIFQLIDNSSLTTSGFVVRLIGLLATGIGIGLGVGVAEHVLRSSWLRFVAGPMTGKEFILYGDRTTIGRDYRCDIVIAKDSSVAPMHAMFTRGSNGQMSVIANTGVPLMVNGVTGPGGSLRSGDTVHIGSSALAYQERVVH